MFDAHCHLDLYADDSAEVWRQVQAAGVHGCVVAGVDPHGWERQAALTLPGVWHTFGLHPWVVAEARDEQLPELLAALSIRLAGTPRPVGLGELGLDHGRRGPPPTRARQERAFRAQLAMARERNLPVVLHIVGAYGKVLELLRQDGLPSAGGMIHRYSGSSELVPDLIGLGLHLSFSPTILDVPRLLTALMAVPEHRLLVETDAPHTPHTGSGGHPDDPDQLARVLQRAAAARGVEAARLARTTEKNAQGLFGLV